MNQPNSNQKYIPFSADRVRFYQEADYWIGQTHIDFLQASVKKYANNTAIIQGNKTLSYAELYNKMSLFGSHLMQQGIKKDDFIIFQSPNVIEYFIVLFGIYYAGARPIFCLDGHGAYEIENIIKISEAKGYIRIIRENSKQDDVDSLINKFTQESPSLHYWETIYSKENDEFFSSFMDHIKQQPPEKIDPTSLAFLQLSGGTTGIPKLIPRTHDDYLYSVRLSAEIAQLSSNTKQLIVLPISHNFTMSSPGVLGALYVGATIILAENGSPDTCFELIEKYGITQVSLVPSLASLWLNSYFLESANLSSLQVIQVGGAKLTTEIASQIIDKLNVKLQQVYGMAEGLVCFTRLTDDITTLINTQGKPLSPADQIVIMDSEGKILKQGEIGNILTKGPYTINGYYNSEQNNLMSFNADGFYITGDIGYLDQNMNIVVTGRARDQINRAGEKISPSELEELIITHPFIKDVSVIGLPDPILGERIKALIITLDNHTISLSTIRTFLIEKNIASYKLPDEIEIVDTFQYTLIGKVKK